MQRRLLISTLAVAVAAVLLLGLPLAFVLSRLQISAGDPGTAARSHHVATGLQDRYDFGLRPTLAQAGAPGRCPTGM